MLLRKLTTVSLAFLLSFCASPASHPTRVTSQSSIATSSRLPKPTISSTKMAEIVVYVKAVEKAKFEAWLEALAVPACGGDLPSCCTVKYESHGNIYAVEPGHLGAPYGDPGDPWKHASGKWQFTPPTWNRFMGYPYAAAAPALVQNEKAREVFDGGRGASNWYGDGCYSGG